MHMHMQYTHMQYTSVRMATSVMVMRDMPVSTAPAPSSAKAPGVRPGWMSASRSSSPKSRPDSPPMTMPGTKLSPGTAMPKMQTDSTKITPSRLARAHVEKRGSSGWPGSCREKMSSTIPSWLLKSSVAISLYSPMGQVCATSPTLALCRYLVKVHLTK